VSQACTPLRQADGCTIIKSIIQRAEVIQLGSDSYRPEYRSAIFDDKTD